MPLALAIALSNPLKYPLIVVEERTVPPAPAAKAAAARKSAGADPENHSKK